MQTDNLNISHEITDDLKEVRTGKRRFHLITNQCSGCGERCDVMVHCGQARSSPSCTRPRRRRRAARTRRRGAPSRRSASRRRRPRRGQRRRRCPRSRPPTSPATPAAATTRCRVLTRTITGEADGPGHRDKEAYETGGVCRKQTRASTGCTSHNQVSIDKQVLQDHFTLCRWPYESTMELLSTYCQGRIKANVMPWICQLHCQHLQIYSKRWHCIVVK